MRRIAVLTALALATGLGLAGTASATECTPKGCSTGPCSGGLHYDLRDGTIGWEPYVC